MFLSIPMLENIYLSSTSVQAFHHLTSALNWIAHANHEGWFHNSVCPYPTKVMCVCLCVYNTYINSFSILSLISFKPNQDNLK